jgi:hypothetical protein
MSDLKTDPNSADTPAKYSGHRLPRPSVGLIAEAVAVGAGIAILILFLLQVGSNAKTLTAMRQDQRTEVAVYHEQLSEDAASIANHQPPASTANLQAYFERNYPGYGIHLTVWRGKQFGGELIRVDSTSPTGHVFRVEGGGAAIYGLTRTCSGGGQPGGCYLVRRPPYGSDPALDLTGSW